MQIDGACHCGQIRYAAEIDPAGMTICHCTDCQVLSGSAFRIAVPTRPGSFRLLAGELRCYVKHGENGKPREQTFCGACGTPIYAAAPGPEPRVLSLRAGTVRQRRELTPAQQYWTRSALPWTGDTSGIRRLETQPAFDPDGGLGR
jgi:hypothetical protein